MTLVLVAVVMSSLALVGLVAVVLYLVIDYRASRAAGEIIERARQTLAPTDWPGRKVL